MEYKTIEVNALSNDNIHTLYGKMYIPLGTLKATVQIIHGMSEHMELYDEFMSELAQNGYIAVIHDQLGHGKTAGSKEALGFFAEKDGDEILIKDAYTFACKSLSEYKDLPHVLFGHSMGSFIARIYSRRYTDMCDMLILSGTGGRQRFSALGLALAHAGAVLKGKEYRPETVQRIFLNFCNVLFREDKNPYAWTTSDKNVQRAHVEDEYYNFVFSFEAMRDVIALSDKCNSMDWYKNRRRDMPTLVLSGSKDPVGEYGEGVSEVRWRVNAFGENNICFVVYENLRHELLHEVNKRVVIDRILEWMSENL